MSNALPLPPSAGRSLLQDQTVPPPGLTSRWSPQLVLEDALCLWDDDELSDRFKVSIGELSALRQLKPYKQAVQQARSEIAAQGLTFKHKARLQAEMMLDEYMPRWIGDVNAPLKDKLAALTKLVEWGELEPKPEAAQVGANAGFVFVVNLPGSSQTIEAMPGRTFDNGG